MFSIVPGMTKSGTNAPVRLWRGVLSISGTAPPAARQGRPDRSTIMVMPDDHENGSHIGDRLADSEDFCGEIESYIRAKPFKSVLVALLIGIIVGKIIL
jgi:hypothetical protein